MGFRKTVVHRRDTEIDIGDGVMVLEVEGGRNPLIRHRGHVREVIVGGSDTPIPGTETSDNEDEPAPKLTFEERFAVFSENATEQSLQAAVVKAPPKARALMAKCHRVLSALSSRGVRIPIELLVTHAS